MLDSAFYLIIPLLVLMFGFFSLVGIIFTIKWIIEHFSLPKNTKTVTFESQNSNLNIEKEIPSKANNDSLQEVIIETQDDIKSSDTTLLYLGSILIIFALFVFVLFTWGRYSSFSKLVIISLVTIAFYVVGYVLFHMKKFKDAGVTFIIIGSVALALSGSGFWNFMFKGNTSMHFWEYWLLHSVVMFVVYFIILKTAKIKSFIYILLITIYSVFMSISMAYFDSSYIRIAIVLMFNTILYILITQQFNKLTITKGIKNFISYVHFLIATVLFLMLFVTTYDTLLANNELIISSFLLLASTVVFSIQSHLIDDSNLKIILSIESLSFLPTLLLLVFFINPFITNKTVAFISVLSYIISYVLLVSHWEEFLGIVHHEIKSIQKEGLFLVLLSSTSAGLAFLFSLADYLRDGTPLGYLTAFIIAILLYSIIYFSHKTKIAVIRYLAIPFEIILAISVSSIFVHQLGFVQKSVSVVSLLYSVLAIIAFIESVLVYKKRKKIHPSFISFAALSMFAILSFLSFGAYSYICVYLLLLIGAFLYYLSLTEIKDFTYLVLYFAYFVVVTFLRSVNNNLHLDNILDFALPLFGFVGIMFLHINQIVANSKILNLFKKNYKILSTHVYFSFYFILGITIYINFDGTLSTSRVATILVAWILMAYGFFISKNNNVKLSFGIPLVAALWLLTSNIEPPLKENLGLIYILPISLYLYALSEATRDIKKYKENTYKIFLMSSYSLLAYVLLSGSLVLPSEITRTIYGISLIVISAVFIVFNLNKKTLIYIPFGFTVIELLIMFIDVIIAIPWWIYIGGIGLSIIAIAIWRTSKKEDTHTIPETSNIKDSKNNNKPDSV